MLKRAMQLASRYSTLAGRRFPNATANRAWGEVSSRVGLLQHILDRVNELNDQYRIESIEDLVKQFANLSTNSQTHQDLHVYTEAFYHGAWRVRELLAQQDYPFKGVRHITADGVRDVRNHILMHPEDHKSPWIDWSWGYGGADGPTLRGQAVVGETGQYRDRGLFINAREFAGELERSIEAGIQYLEILPSPTDGENAA